MMQGCDRRRRCCEREQRRALGRDAPADMHVFKSTATRVLLEFAQVV